MIWSGYFFIDKQYRMLHTCSFTVQIATNNLTEWIECASTAKNLLTCLLKVDPAYRMSANQLLENPWITVRH